MSYRPSSIYSSNSNSTSSTLQPSNPAHSALQSRITAKRLELENLRQLRDLSATLAAQMTSLEQKLATLRDGTEAVATVLGNWDGVLGVIGMVGANVHRLAGGNQEDREETKVRIKDGNEGEDGEGGEELEGKKDLPVTLVRIPVETQEDSTGD